MVSAAATEKTTIDLRNVSKVYRRGVAALRGVDVAVHRGEVFGLLGPNGAGKSTLVKIMMTVVRPTTASGTVLGRPLGHKPTLARVGYLPENHRFPRYLTGRQVLHFFAALSGVDRATRRRRAGELLELVGMSGAADRAVSTYSKGMMQRVGLAQALVNDPDLVVLDEPTDGVDPVGRRDIRTVIGELRRRGKSVFINSHQLAELDALCDRVAILLAGQVVKQGTIRDLAEEGQRYEVEWAWPDGIEDRQRLLAALPGVFPAAAPAPGAADHGTLPGGLWVKRHGSLLRIGTTDAADLQDLLDALRRQGLILQRVQFLRPTLEELFMSAVGQPGGPPSRPLVSPPPLPPMPPAQGGTP